ncbi:MAG: flavin reductase family protein [Clostridiaceae bacterium]|nr:flavin reductase family protein [Clostridiaceae bacterium]
MAQFEDKNLTTWTTQGGFLSSGGNVMTATWGFIGFMWGKRVLIVPVRDSRHTKTFLDKTGEFTFSVPADGELKKELAYCGKVSGRDADKFAVAGLKKEAAKSAGGFVVGGCKHYFECKVLTVCQMKGCDVSKVSAWYKDGDLHNFYFGEIVAEY